MSEISEAGRRDYDQLIDFKSAKAPGEPYFVIFAHDELSAAAVRAWAALAHAAGVPIAQVENALQQADIMAAWPDKRLPDADHLKEQEQRQLTYQFGRRAWNAQEDCADPRVMLAEERAIADALGRVRPLLNAFLQHCKVLPDGKVVYTPPASMKVDPSFSPLEGLRRLETVLRAAAPKSPNAAVGVPELARISYETRTGYPRAIHALAWVTGWSELDPLTQANEQAAVEAVLRALYQPTPVANEVTDADG